MSTWQWVVLTVLTVVFVGGCVYSYFADCLVDWLVMGTLGAVIVVLGVVGIPAMVDDQNHWEQWCRDQGGTVSDHTSTTTVVTVSGNGQPGVGVGSETTYYCLTADGRVLDVR